MVPKGKSCRMRKMTNYVSNLLDRITMYRLMLYFLLFIFGWMVLLTTARVLSYNPLDILLAGVFFGIICNGANYLFARLFGARTNLESASITALILSLIVGPLPFLPNTLILGVIGVLSQASKYVFAVRRKHIFNPAALAVFITAIVMSRGASWFVGSIYTLPLIFLGGVLILLKIKRLEAALSFFTIYLLTSLLSYGLNGTTLLSSPIWFFMFVMLIEPLTSPSNRNLQIIFGALTAFSLFLIQQIFPSFPYGVETALLVGNVFSFIASPASNNTFEFKKKAEVARDTWTFYFEPTSIFKFLPGQYAEWTYPHSKPDSRGVRRYFSISSAPGEGQVSLTMRYSPEHSSFKEALFNMKAGEKIEVSGPMGEFVLPRDASIPLCFIAGGIGITPFRSMIGHLLEKGEKRDIVLFYSNKTEEEVAFRDILDKAESIGVKTIYVLTEKDGYIDEKMIKERMPDYKERAFYISGPERMVRSFSLMLSRLGVRRVKTDFFPGYGGR